MSRSISGNYSTAITLTSSNNPVTVTGQIDAYVASGSVLDGPGGTSWSITNSGQIHNTGSFRSIAVAIGASGDYAPTALLTNLNGGNISGAGSGIIIQSSAGFLSNSAGGVIEAGYFSGVGMYGGNATVVNDGVILARHTPKNIAGSYSEGNGVVLYDGGEVINAAGATISGTRGGVILSGSYKNPGVYNPGDAIYATTLDNAGTIIGNGLGGAVNFYSYSTANRLIDHPGAVFVGGTYQSTPGDAVYHDVTGNGGTLELASGSSIGVVSGFGTNFTGFQTIQFDRNAAWSVSGGSGDFSGVNITGFNSNDTLTLTGFTEAHYSFSGDTLTLTNSSSGTVSLQVQENPGSHFTVTNSGGNTLIEGPVCFLAGTFIATPDGEVPVQTLKAGDTVLTAHNGPRTVAWVGTGKVLATRGKRSAATPVIVRKSALAGNRPHQDLRITKAHSLYIDDVLIPVEFLVNHRTILWDDRAQEVEIYHVELESHDILIANGVPAESYRDDGNRWLFRNANSGWHLPPQDPCAPVLTGGPIVDTVWRRLRDRAGPRDLPPLTNDPDLHLIVDGVRIDAQEHTGSVYIFRLSGAPGSVIVASRDAVPSELGIARDPRALGVALRRVTIRQGARFILLDAGDDRLTAGFHDYEPADNLRWTDGFAELPIEAFAQFSKGAEVVLHLGGATRYPDQGEDSRQVAA